MSDVCVCGVRGARDVTRLVIGVMVREEQEKHGRDGAAGPVLNAEKVV